MALLVYFSQQGAFRDEIKELQRGDPPSSKSVAEILAAFEDPDIMETFGSSKHQEARPFFITAREEERFSYCIFASKKSIELMEANIQEKDRCFLVDATFKVVPNGIFNQLLIIFVEYINMVKILF